MRLRSIGASFVEVARIFTAAGWSVVIVGGLLTFFGFRWSHRETATLGIAMLLVLLVALAWMVRRTDMKGSRVVEPSRVTEGDDARAVVTIENQSDKRSPRVTGLDYINGEAHLLSIPPIPGGESSVETYDAPTDQRGEFSLGPLSVAHTDPFRLLRAGNAIGTNSSYLVWPRTALVSPLPTGRVRDLEGAATPRTAGSGVTFHALREYVPGDDRRQIHWRSSARTGTLQVRENVVTSEPRMVVFVDCRLEAYDNAGFEDACRIAASLVEAGVRGSNPVEVMASTGATAFVESSGFGDSDAIDLIARLRRSKSDESIVRLARLTRRRHAGSSIAVVTGDVLPEHSRLLTMLQSRYATFVAIQVGAEAAGSAVALSRAAAMRVRDLDDFAAQWRNRLAA